MRPRFLWKPPLSQPPSHWAPDHPSWREAELRETTRPLSQPNFPDSAFKIPPLPPRKALVQPSRHLRWRQREIRSNMLRAPIGRGGGGDLEYASLLIWLTCLQKYIMDIYIIYIYMMYTSKIHTGTACKLLLNTGADGKAIVTLPTLLSEVAFVHCSDSHVSTCQNIDRGCFFGFSGESFL